VHPPLLLLLSGLYAAYSTGLLKYKTLHKVASAVKQHAQLQTTRKYIHSDNLPY
jgi:hypothetical protein